MSTDTAAVWKSDRKKEAAKKTEVRAGRQQKLLFQIMVMLVPLLVIMLFLVSQTMYQSTVNGYLEGQSNLMADRLNSAFEYSFYSDGEELSPVDDFYYNYWETHPEVYTDPSTEEESKALTDYYDTVSELPFWEVETVQSMPEDLLLISAKLRVEILEGFFSYDSSSHENEGSRPHSYEYFLMDVNEPFKGFILSSYSKEETVYSHGDTLRYSLSDHPAIVSLINNPSDRVEFETVHDFPGGGDYYIALKPIIFEGKLRAVLGLAYSWSGLRTAMSAILSKAFLVGIGGLVFSLLLLLILVYNKAILPVRKIQESIQTYIRTKDSAVVSERLSSIRERNEIGLLSDDLSEMVQAINHYTEENVRMAEDKKKVETELTLASAIQDAMLPKDFPEHAAFSLSASMIPAKEVGGDFYDFFFTDEDHLALVIADVSGKGIPAALFMMMCKNMIKNFTREGLSPSEVLDRTNRNILENSKNTMFVTIWIGIYEISTGHVTASNAGHEYPFLRKAGGSFELFKDKHSMIAGGLDIAVYKEYGFDLEKGGTLFLYTDGVTEATGPESELFGTNRMLETLNLDPDGAPDELIRRMKAAIDDFVGDNPQFDDLTMLVLRRK